MVADGASGDRLDHRTPGKDGRIYRSLRFSAYGSRRFARRGPVTARKAEAELRHVLADVERTEEIGHRDPTFTWKVYRQTMGRSEDEKSKLRALVEAGHLAAIGSRGEDETTEPDLQDAA